MMDSSMSKADYDRFQVYYVNLKSIRDHITHFSPAQITEIIGKIEKYINEKVQSI